MTGYRRRKCEVCGELFWKRVAIGEHSKFPNAFICSDACRTRRPEAGRPYRKRRNWDLLGGPLNARWR